MSPLPLLEIDSVITKPTIDAFSFISFSSICRLGNSVVYNLAKHARYASGYSI